MAPQRLGRVLMLVVIVSMAALSTGCEGSVGVGVGVGYPYGGYGPYGGWGTGPWVGGPVWY